jgi:hypothetical protein
MMDRRSILLGACSTLVALLLCEAGLRVFTTFGAGQQKAVVSPTPPPKSTGLEIARRYMAALRTAPGTDPAWFLEDPPPLANRGKPSAVDIARYDDFTNRKIYPAQAQYIWNAKYIEATGCEVPGVFANFPENASVFDPPDGTHYPHFRFPPSSTLPSGLVTNRFGFRGPEIGLAKPPRTIRIAFAGASTTVHVHNLPFSYPDRVGDWLNRYARANGLDVRFEAINAGREGIGSTDIAAIIREEVLPLDPDLVVYYEGSNQFMGAPSLASAERVRRGPRLDWGAWLGEKTALGNLLARAGALPTGTGEPPKPKHKLVWPASVNPASPDPDDPALPLQLPTIVRDLESVREALRPSGGRLVLASFVWLAGEHLRISQIAHPHIWRYLNEALQPLTYAEIRRIADFQNLVFRRYTETRGIEFLDVAAQLPQDPSLFSDAIHLFEPAERLKAWIVFQQMVPSIRREIDAGHLPRQAPPGSLPPPVSLAVHTFERRCPRTVAAAK